METSIPELIITEILLRLPLKSLGMFKVVCKSWHSIISSKFFVEKQTQNQMITYYGNNYLCDIMRDDHRWEVPETLLPRFKSNVNMYFNDRMRYSNGVLIGGIDGRFESGEYVISLYKDYGSNKFHAFKIETKVVHCPILDTYDCSRGKNSRIIGSCNGLVCIYNNKYEIALWNPTTGDVKVVPPSQLQRPEIGLGNSCDVGFGFDSCTNDYKIVQIFLLGDSCSVQHMKIYSLSTNSWKEFDHSTFPGRRFRPHLNSYYGSMVHKSEIFCWSAISRMKGSSRTLSRSSPTLLYDEQDVILWIDMRYEVFRTTPFPYHSLSTSFTRLKMCPLHDSISLIFYCDYDRCIHSVDKTIEIWSIKDLHDKDSWTKLLNICPLSSRVIWPLGFWNNGEFMVLKNDSNELLLYNFRTGKFVTMGIQGHCRFRYLTSCIETLVSADGYSSV